MERIIFTVRQLLADRNVKHILLKPAALMSIVKNNLKRSRCCQTSDISGTSVGNIIVDHSDVVGTSPVGTATIMSSFSTYLLASVDWAKTTAR